MENHPEPSAANRQEIQNITTLYADLVYAAALRQVRNPHTAQDIAQAVFLVLIKKINDGKSPDPRFIAGWLLKVTQYVVHESRRESQRRIRREQRSAAEGKLMHDDSKSLDTQDALDAALLTLPALDREIIIRRYLQELTITETAAALKMSDNTLSKRLARALDKLRSALSHDRIAPPVAILLKTLTEQAAIKAPLAAPAATTLAQTLAHRVLHRLLITKVITISLTLTAAILLTVATVALAWPSTSSTTSEPTASTIPTALPITTDWGIAPLIKVEQPSPPSDQLLTTLYRGIAENRQKLLSLQLEGQTIYEEWDPKTKSWTDAGGLQGKGSIESATPRRYHVEMARSHSVWTNGARPYYDESFTETWDGQEGRRLYGPPFSNRSGEISPRKFFGLAKGIFGGAYSTQFMQTEFSETDPETGEIHDYQQDPLSPDLLKHMNVQAQKVLMNSIPAIQLTVRFKTPIPQDFSKKYWFDPAKGYALLAMSEGADGQDSRNECYIDQLTEAAPGIFYPSHVRYLWRSGRTATDYSRLEFIATNITANQPLDESQFHLTFPPTLKYIARHDAGTASQPTTER